MNELQRLWADILDDKVSFTSWKPTAEKLKRLFGKLLQELDEQDKRIAAIEKALNPANNTEPVVPSVTR